MPKRLIVDSYLSVKELVRRLARRYNQQGPEGLRDRRHDHSGRPPFLEDLLCSQIRNKPNYYKL